MRVCVCVCVCVFIHVHTYVSVFIPVFTHVSVFIHVLTLECVYTYVFIHSCVCVYPRLPGPVCALQSLYNTVPGLHTYGQPDTRAMNTNALLKERRLSVSVSVMSDSDSDDSSVPPFTRSSTRPGKGNGSKQNLRPRALSATERAGNNRSGVDGGGAGRSGRESPAKTGGGGARSVGRPSTAGPFGGAQSPPLQKRPSTSFTHHRSLGPKYGKNAYSEHDQSQRDKVLKKFQVIFDPEKKARTVNLSTFSTPIVVVASESDNRNSSNSNNNNNNNGKIHPTRTVIQVNGEEFHLDRKPQNHRRVVWSAQPGRKRGVMSAPSSARSRRPCSGSPAAAARAASSKLHSPSLTLLNGKAGHAGSGGGGGASARGSPHRPVSPGRLDPKILALALQRELPVDYVSRPEKSSSDVPLKVDSPCITRSQSPAAQLNPPRKSSPEAKAQPKLSEGAKKQSILHGHVKDCHPGAQIQPANHLQVPGSDQHPIHHHHHHHHPHHHHHSHHQHQHHHHHQQQQQNGPASESGGQSRWTMVRNSIQRSPSRMSDTSDITPPVELLAKLMRAGSKPGGEPTRPKTAAPSKSELSHRSMPAPRRTVAGILAQIENQKAHTRAMLDTSKQLQKLVKKLVPREKLVVKHSEDW